MARGSTVSNLLWQASTHLVQGVLALSQAVLKILAYLLMVPLAAAWRLSMGRQRVARRNEPAPRRQRPAKSQRNRLLRRHA
jgi:hypothetical protein